MPHDQGWAEGTAHWPGLAARQGGASAAVCLSAFAHPRDVMERWLREHHIPRRWIGTAILDHVQEVIGERFDHIAPVHQLPRIACPVLCTVATARRRR